MIFLKFRPQLRHKMAPFKTNSHYIYALYRGKRPSPLTCILNEPNALQSATSQDSLRRRAQNVYRISSPSFMAIRVWSIAWPEAII